MNRYASAHILDLAAVRSGFARRQYLGPAADQALARLRDAYADGLISIDTLESVTEDIVFGRPAKLPLLPPRNPTKPERR